MQTWSPGDVTVLGLLVTVVLTPALLAVFLYLCGRHEERLIRIAQHLEIKEGVTLLQGVRALSGEDGLWILDGRWVLVMAGHLEGCPPGGILCVDVKTWRPGIFHIGRGGPPVDEEGADIVIAALVWAAKDRDTAPEDKNGGAG